MIAQALAELAAAAGRAVPDSYETWPEAVDRAYLIGRRHGLEQAAELAAALQRTVPTKEPHR